MSGNTRLYSDYLTQQGYRPTVDSDGDVVFKEEGRIYYIDIDTSDNEYFRLVFPNFWEISGSDELAKAICAANEATRSTKVAKVYVRGDGKETSASIEMFFSNPDQFKAVFTRSMSALKTAVKHFVDEMK